MHYFEMSLSDNNSSADLKEHCIVNFSPLRDLHRLPVFLRLPSPLLPLGKRNQRWLDTRPPAPALGADPNSFWVPLLRLPQGVGQRSTQRLRQSAVHPQRVSGG